MSKYSKEEIHYGFITAVSFILLFITSGFVLGDFIGLYRMGLMLRMIFGCANGICWIVLSYAIFKLLLLKED